MDNEVLDYNIDKLVEATKEMEDVSVGGSKCYDFGDKVLVKYTMSAKYGDARKEAEKIKDKIDHLKDKGVPNICRYLQIKREVVGNNSICWVLQEKAKGAPCVVYKNMKDVEDVVIGMIADYPGLDYIGKNKHFVYGVPYEQIKDLLFSTYQLLDAGVGLEPKSKNVFYDETIGYTHIDYLLSGKYYAKLLPWERCVYIINYARIAMLQALPDFVSKEVRERMERDLKKCAFEVLPDYKKYKPWIEKEVDLISNGDGKILTDAEKLEIYINGLKKMRAAEVKRNARLVKEGKENVLNCRPSDILQDNMDFIPPENVKIDEQDLEWGVDLESAKRIAFTEEMQKDVEKYLERELNDDLSQ